MIDIDNDEIEALNTWNCAMLIKRKQRALLCKSFCKWKQNTNDISNVKPTDSTISSKSQIRSPTKRETSTRQPSYTNQALQEELDTLIEEQKELEEATSQIKKSLKDIPRPSQTRYRSQYAPSASGRYSQSGRLNYI